LTATPKIKVSLGEPLPFWDRSVIFFSNIHSIFYDNVEGSKELIQEISGAATYGGRVLSILNLLFHGRPNLILLETAPDKSLTHYLSSVLGLSLPDYAILDHRGYRMLASAVGRKGRLKNHPSYEKLRQHPAPWIDGFVTDASLVKIAAALKKQTVSTLEGSRDGNNKYLLYQYQREQKLPVFDTLVASDRDELPACLRELRRMEYAKAVVKAQIGASGYGMAKLATENDRAEKVPDHLFFEGACMVQGWIEDEAGKVMKIGSPSVQLFVSDDSLFLFDLTEQVLDREGVHEGNVCPPAYLQEWPGLQDELLRQASIAGAWLYRQGYRGTASTDFLVVRKKQKTEVILCEINARVTGATYPAVLARHFKPQGAWYMRNIGFRKGVDGAELLSLMDHAGVLYRPAARKGVIPFNFNTDTEGKVIKGQFLCLGEDINECAGLFVQAWAQLPVEWGYDRD
jgi:hypothetical protein